MVLKPFDDAVQVEDVRAGAMYCACGESQITVWLPVELGSHLTKGAAFTWGLALGAGCVVITLADTANIVWISHIPD